MEREKGRERIITSFIESFRTVRNHGLECVSKVPKTIVCCKNPAGDEVEVRIFSFIKVALNLHMHFYGVELTYASGYCGNVAIDQRRLGLKK
ncbi:hypothetical protein MTR_2g089915 [Medicago truncatula]|uniref:Uncharacterized protein n=1 Tax=Medicago truncatula TaxID=3880 RepID=A0A072VB78_MEDTR|nr:hypothetical protein MTR_2g089915 [Medicago truncatula]